MMSPCNSKDGLKRGAWTVDEDRILAAYIKANGARKWSLVPKKAGLNRCGKSCRLRWLNYLRPDIKRGHISPEEEDLITRLHKLLGNRWSLIAGRIPGRTDNEIKNYWNTVLKKKLQKEKPAEAQPMIGQPHIESLVVRTKATRCTRVVVEPKFDDGIEFKDCVMEEDSNGSISLPSIDDSLFYDAVMTGDFTGSGEEPPSFSWELGSLAWLTV